MADAGPDKPAGTGPVPPGWQRFSAAFAELALKVGPDASKAGARVAHERFVAGLTELLAPSFSFSSGETELSALATHYLRGTPFAGAPKVSAAFGRLQAALMAYLSAERAVALAGAATFGARLSKLAPGERSPARYLTLFVDAMDAARLDALRGPSFMQCHAELLNAMIAWIGLVTPRGPPARPPPEEAHPPEGTAERAGSERERARELAGLAERVAALEASQSVLPTKPRPPRKGTPARGARPATARPTVKPLAKAKANTKTNTSTKTKTKTRRAARATVAAPAPARPSKSGSRPKAPRR